MNTPYLYIAACCMALTLTACSNDESTTPDDSRREMTFDVRHPGAVTRVTSTAFEANDQVGIYLTEAGKPLDLAGNHITNIPLTFNGTQWNAPMKLYWDNGTYDAYAYYPYTKTVASVTDMPFSLATDQSQQTGYDQSDLLWAKTVGVQASGEAVPLQFGHRMSRLLIQLAKGEDYEGDLPDDVDVYIHNTVTDGTVDLNAGIVTPLTRTAAKTIHARSLGAHRYAAIVMPQRLDNRVPLVEVVTHGVSYLYEGKFLFKMGTQHNVLLVLSDNPDRVKIEVGGEIQQWD